MSRKIYKHLTTGVRTTEVKVNNATRIEVYTPKEYQQLKKQKQ